LTSKDKWRAIVDDMGSISATKSLSVPNNAGASAFVVTLPCPLVAGRQAAWFPRFIALCPEQGIFTRDAPILNFE